MRSCGELRPESSSSRPGRQRKGSGLLSDRALGLFREKSPEECQEITFEIGIGLLKKISSLALRKS
jgi:hypothetical protein